MSMFTIKVTQPPDPTSALSHFITTFSPGPAPVMHISTPTSPYESNAEAARQAADYFIGLVKTDVEKAILDQLNAANPAGNVPEGQMIPWKVPGPGHGVQPFSNAVSPPPPPPWKPGGFSGSTVKDTLISVFPGLAGAKAAPPCLPGECEEDGWVPGDGYELTRVVVHLNDAHQWTREQIADWLETLDVDLSAKPNTEKETAA